MNALKRWWPLLFLAVVAALPLNRALLAGEAIGPWEHIGAMAPWNLPTPEEPWDILQADGVIQFSVWRDLVFEAWGEGQLPLWNNYQLMGTPLMANSQSGTLYPPHILMGVLHVPTLTAIKLLAWFHLFWAGLGLFYLVRRMGGSRLGGAVAGASFSLSAFMVAWSPLASVITTVAWIPWVLGLIVALFCEHPLQEIRRSTPSADPIEHLKRMFRLDRRQMFRTFALAISLAMLVLGGHLQFVAYGLMAALLLTVCLLIGTIRPQGSLDDMYVMKLGKRGEPPTEIYPAPKIPILSMLTSSGLRAGITTAIAVALGLALAAPQLLPVLEYSKFSHRQNVASEEGYQAYLGGAVSSFQLPGIVFPAALGNPVQMSENDQMQRLSASTYWPALAKIGANFAESAISIGPLVLVLLAFIGPRWRDPAVIALAAVAALGVLVAFGTEFNRLLYFNVPGWSATGSPGRAGVLFVMAMCALAGIGATRVSEAGKAEKIGALILLLFGLYTFSLPVNMAVPDPYQIGAQVMGSIKALPIISAALPVVFASIIALAWVAIPRSQDHLRRAWLLGAAVVVWPLAYNLAFPVHTGKPFDMLQFKPEGRVAAINMGWDLLGRPRALLPPNTAAWNRIHDVAGYDSLLHRDTKTFLDSVNGQDSAPPANGNMMFIKPRFDKERLADAGVTEVWATDRLRGMGRPKAINGPYGVWDLPGPGRASTTQGPAQITEERFDGLTLKAQGPGKLILRDRLMPGWKVEVDGQRQDMPEALFREVDLDEGEHTVVFTYEAPGFRTGAQAAAVSGVVLLGLVGMAFRRRFPVQKQVPREEQPGLK